MRKVPYTYTMEFSTTVNAGQVSNFVEMNIDTDADFVCEDMSFTAFLAATQGGALATTPAAKEASVTVGNNTFMHYAAFRLEVEQPGYKWQNNPVRVTNLIREGVQNLALTQRTFGKGTVVRGKLYNDATTFNVQGQVAFIGYKTYPD